MGPAPNMGMHRPKKEQVSASGELGEAGRSKLFQDSSRPVSYKRVKDGRVELGYLAEEDKLGTLFLCPT